MKLPKSKYEQTKLWDLPLVKEMKCVQDLFSIVSIDESGVFELVGKHYSKLYVLSDINFAGVTDEEQKAIIINFSKVLKTIPCRFSFSVANEHVDEKALSSCLKREILPEEQGMIDSVIEKVYSENYAMRKRINGVQEEASEYKVPGYMRQREVYVNVATSLSNKEQIKAYSPTLQDVYQGLLDEGSMVGSHLAAAMEIFVNGSLNLFNHRTNVDLSNRFIVFDLSGLKENLRSTSMLIMMETVRSKIKENAGKNQWTHLYIDEFHELLGVEQVADFVLKLWKEMQSLEKD